jgi:hypothetical protein
VKHKAFAGDSLANQLIRPASDFNVNDDDSLRNIRSATPEEVKRVWVNRPRNTQRSSTIRSEINDGVEIRDIPCLRCAGEISEFPHLQCWTSPNSIAGKCGDCVRKHGFCYEVCSHFQIRNQFLGSLATPGCFANDPLDSR